MEITIINGPNLNLLGTREPDVYGDRTFQSFFQGLQRKYPDIQLAYYQSNAEGGIVDKIQSLDKKADGIILNAAAYTHTSVAIADAISAISTPVIEVHISNVAAREAFRRHSYLSPVCSGTIFGFGLLSYELALIALTNKSY